jgi:hypothetical protein
VWNARLSIPSLYKKGKTNIETRSATQHLHFHKQTDGIQGCTLKSIGEVCVNEKKELASLFALLSRLYTIVDLHVWNALLSTSSLNKKGKTKIKTQSATILPFFTIKINHHRSNLFPSLTVANHQLLHCFLQRACLQVE